MKKNILILTWMFSLNLISIYIYAQQNPHQITDAEKNMMRNYLSTRAALSVSTTSVLPPDSPVRTIGEWEEIQGLLIAWTSYPSMLTEIVRNSQNECTVYIVCTDSNAVKSTLTSSSVPLTNLVFLEPGFNSVWARDYGPWSAYTNDVDTLITIDWIYNRPRPLDDAVPVAVATALGTPLYQTTTAPWDLVHTGGNFMCDGFGTAFSSNLVLNENSGHTPAEVDTIMKHFMGINRYIRMTTLPYDVIHHIDMHIKLINEETLVVGQYPVGVADGPQIEANLQYILANYNSIYGTPYKVIRIPMPPDGSGQYPDAGGDYRTYTNSSFVNKTLLVPTYQQQYDTTALRIYREALPGYNVVGINSNVSIPALGAIHCITKDLGTSDPLLISHSALPDTYDNVNPFAVNALIKHRSGIANATLYYRTDTLLPYQPVAMSLMSVPLNTWSAQIPSQNYGTNIYYYIDANSNSGKHQVRPMPAPAGYWHFRILQPAAVSSPTERSRFSVEMPFPNPSKGITCIPVNSSKEIKGSLILRNILGIKVMNIFEGIIHQGESKYFLDTSLLASGVYTIEINTLENSEKKKLIVR